MRLQKYTSFCFDNHPLITFEKKSIMSWCKLGTILKYEQFLPIEYLYIYHQGKSSYSSHPMLLASSQNNSNSQLPTFLHNP
mmetsp:Transcript_32985/g.67308  ORF Transcript_32985/g.67308 Transcript_32985/m.67308 type:complete len:81 (+) Transcript_32985:411-653(+)